MFLHHSRFRVGLFVDFLQLLNGIVGIYLCSGQATVTEKVFYGVQIGPVVEQVRGKGMP